MVISPREMEEQGYGMRVPAPCPLLNSQKQLPFPIEWKEKEQTFNERIHVIPSKCSRSTPHNSSQFLMIIFGDPNGYKVMKKNMDIFINTLGNIKYVSMDNS